MEARAKTFTKDKTEELEKEAHVGGRGYLQSQGWLPHSGTTHPALFASYWPLTEGGKTTSAAWTVVSRGKAQSAHGYPKPALTNVPPPP